MSQQSLRFPVSGYFLFAAILCMGESALAQGTSTATRDESQSVTHQADGLQSTLVDDSRVAVQPRGEEGAPRSFHPSARSSFDSKPLALSNWSEDPQGATGQTGSDTRDVRKGRDAEDEVAQRQSVDYWNPIEDGQPGAAGNWEVKFDAGWKTFSGQHDPFSLTSQVQYTPEGGHFLHNMKIGVAVPVTMGLGDVEGNGDAVLEWKQRWLAEQGAMPTLATVIDIRLPSGYQSSGVDGTLTGVVAKDLGPGTMIFNGFVKTANGDNLEELRHFQWGFRAGYKWRVSDSFSLIGDYLHQSSEEDGHANINSLQLAGEYHVNEHVTIGPGISIGLDDHEETPNFGAGVRVQFSF